MTKADMIIELAQASKKGKTLQCRRIGCEVWSDMIGFNLDTFNYEYRIKLEPRTIYVNEYKRGYTVFTDTVTATACFKEEEGLRCAVPYREIIEDTNT